MSLKQICSLKDCKELKKLIIENPELPLLIFCGEESWNGEYAYAQADYNGARVEEVTLYNEYWLEKDDYREQLSYDLEDEYENLSNEEYTKMINRKVAETEFVKAIVVYVG